MKNYLQPGDVVDLPAPVGGCVSGGAYLIGSMFVVAVNTAAAAEIAAFRRRGAYTLDKATGETWAVGDAIYWDNTAKKCTKTTASNKAIGHAIAVQASADTSGKVVLSPTVA